MNYNRRHVKDHVTFTMNVNHHIYIYFFFRCQIQEPTMDWNSHQNGIKTPFKIVFIGLNWTMFTLIKIAYISDSSHIEKKSQLEIVYNNVSTAEYYSHQLWNKCYTSLLSKYCFAVFLIANSCIVSSTLPLYIFHSPFHFQISWARERNNGSLNLVFPFIND